LQLHHFNQAAVISTTTKLLTNAGAAAGNEQPIKPSQLIGINESQQQTKSSPETAEEEQPKQQQNETDEPQHLQLAKASIAIGPNRNIEIECHQGASGHRFIKISRFIIRK
jgi:phage repressor protein C with HTH and peptisase S24 domain